MYTYKTLSLFTLASVLLSLSFTTSAQSRSAAEADFKRTGELPREIQETNSQINDTKGYFYRRARGSRIDRSKTNKCNKKCQEKIALRKTLYLGRALSANSSTIYQKVLESKLFSDQEFVSKCWKKSVDKGIDFFFTVTETGKAADIEWFPKERSAKCIKRYVKDIEFPQPQAPHHAWLVVAEIESALKFN